MNIIAKRIVGVATGAVVTVAIGFFGLLYLDRCVRTTGECSSIYVGHAFMICVGAFLVGHFVAGIMQPPAKRALLMALVVAPGTYVAIVLVFTQPLMGPLLFVGSWICVLGGVGIRTLITRRKQGTKECQQENA